MEIKRNSASGSANLEGAGAGDGAGVRVGASKPSGTKIHPSRLPFSAGVQFSRGSFLLSKKSSVYGKFGAL